ncbi:NahK/ErcS family hybrid sensor histidine kinase/response regulator [Pelagibius sp. Alg239-R121]|uniref:hybrid sensor histidine kinase/response regulator n=1 Tax=Pelagibius sp. Alg239-R121 TaxID=2993448 RepID=UPI0024A79074|nr:NahK/ErcS family hybrid sensor histidine kinase/response regulator [Pelagibius sp. Alg239-R121]
MSIQNTDSPDSSETKADPKSQKTSGQSSAELMSFEEHQDLAGTDGAQPDSAQLDSAQPDLAQPDLAQLDLAQLDLAQPDLARTDPAERIEELEQQVARLSKINDALMKRVERSIDYHGNSFSLFQTAILLENQVRDRTEELKHALNNLEHSNTALTIANEEAETARTRLADAIESLSEGFALFDADDLLVQSNSKFRALYPDMEDTIAPGMTFEEFLRSILERDVLAIPKSDHESWIEQRLRHHRDPDDAILLSLANGRWIQVSERPTKNGTVGIYTDVTEIKKVESQRRERELEEKSIQLTATLDNLAQGVSVFDHHHHLAYWNKHFVWLTGLSQPMVREGMRFDQILGSPEVKRAFPDTDMVSDLVDWLRYEGGAQPLRAEYHRRDGVVIEVRRNAIPDGGFVSTYTDVTEQRRTAKVLEEAKENLEIRVQERTAELTELNEQLKTAKAMAEEANLSKTKFLAAASHDLLQPLNAARLFVSALLDSDPSDEVNRLIERVYTALESVDGLLKALFDISKLDTGTVTPEWREFPVDILLEALASEFALLAENKGLVFRVVPSHVVIKSDMLLLRRILQNFVSNAVRYTSEGQVLLGCRRKANALSIEIWDTGPGIREEHQRAVFDEFQRFVHPNSGNDTGFGLGLAIAKRSARILNHPLKLRSVAGQGAMFAVEVPYGRVNSLDTMDLTPALHKNYGLGNATIIFVENDQDNLEAMAALLERWSCHVIGAHDGVEASSLMEQEQIHPDLIIADYHLDDGRTGIAAISEIRRHCRSPVPGIIVTADHTSAVRMEVKDAGFELLQKPVKPAELRSLMSHLLA